MGKRKPKGGKKKPEEESESTGSKEKEIGSPKSDTSSDYYTARSSVSLSSGGSTSGLSPIEVAKKETSPLTHETSPLTQDLGKLNIGPAGEEGDNEPSKRKKGGKKKGQQKQQMPAPDLEEVKEEVISTTPAPAAEVAAAVSPTTQPQPHKKRKQAQQQKGQKKQSEAPQQGASSQHTTTPQVVPAQPAKLASEGQQQIKVAPKIPEQARSVPHGQQESRGPPRSQQQQQQTGQTQSKKQPQPTAGPSAQTFPVEQPQPPVPTLPKAWGAKQPPLAQIVAPTIVQTQQTGAPQPKQQQHRGSAPPQPRGFQQQRDPFPPPQPPQGATVSPQQQFQRGAVPRQEQKGFVQVQQGATIPTQSSQPQQFGDFPSAALGPRSSSSLSQVPPGAPAPKKPDQAGDTLELYKCPKRTIGTLGRPIKIETNHFALNVGTLDVAYHYDVAIDPDKPKRLMRLVMDEFRRRFYPKNFPAYDGTKNLYSAKRLPLGVSDCLRGEIMLAEDQNSREKAYQVQVKFATEVDLTVLKKYFKSNGLQGHLTTPQEAIRCIDIVLRNAPALAMTPVGRSFFSPPRGSVLSLEDGMEMWYGFYQSAILGWKPFLNVDIVHKAFPKAQHVLQLMSELCRVTVEALDISTPGMRDVERFLKGLKVQIEFPRNPSSRRSMRVNGFSQRPASQEFFEHENKKLTVQKYFESIKNVKLHYPHLPCLWVGSKDKRVYYPVELCTVMAGQVTQRKMTPNQTRNMIKQSATSTTIRKQRILEQFRSTNHQADNCIREFGLSVADAFEKVDARVLPPPKVNYGKAGDVVVSKGQWRALNFLRPAQLKIWTVLILDNVRPNKVDEFLAMTKSVGREVGMEIAEPLKPFVNNSRMRYGREKDELKDFFQKAVEKKMQLVFVIIPDQGNMYSNVKQAAELAVGCLTQCITSRTMFKINAATVGNILLKVNAKLNGTNHHISNTCKPLVFQKPVMIMGADVTHPPPESQDRPSVAAVTASHDPGAFRYNICWRLQPPKEEIIVDLENIVVEQLKFFYRMTNCKPQKIIFYRDGVSEGQFDTVRNREITAIRGACSRLEQGTYRPAITFFVVQKRHHTRFFPTNEKDTQDRNLNVPAGTCVDRIITHPTASDFYLVSHASIQGVARPTKYRTLWDDNNMTEDEIEQLTYYLCHMFSRCNRSVSYPAPTYYAHLAAARANVYFETEQIRLDDLLTEQNRRAIKDAIRIDFPMFFV